LHDDDDRDRAPADRLAAQAMAFRKEGRRTALREQSRQARLGDRDEGELARASRRWTRKAEERAQAIGLLQCQC